MYGRTSIQCVAHTQRLVEGIGANRDDPTVQGEGSALRCSPTAAGRVTFTFWKAKTFGVHTKVGSTTIDLSQYAGYRALFTWQLD